MAFFWFAHHFNMATSPAMTHIRENGGMEAYGQANAFLELLVEVKNEFDTTNKMMMTVLMSRIMVKKIDKAQKFLDLLLETDEFFINSVGKISSNLISTSKKLNDRQVEGGKIGAKIKKDKGKILGNPEGDLEVTYNLLEDNTVTQQNKTEQNKKEQHPTSTEDNKKEQEPYNITYCKTKNELEIARTTYRREQGNVRTWPGMEETKINNELQNIKAEADRLFVLEEGR